MSRVQASQRLHRATAARNTAPGQRAGARGTGDSGVPCAVAGCAGASHLAFSRCDPPALTLLIGRARVAASALATIAAAASATLVAAADAAASAACACSLSGFKRRSLSDQLTTACQSLCSM